jgi:hypothetical protein
MPDDQPKRSISDRTYRRLRVQFRKELLGTGKPTPSDQALIDLAAQAGLRVRQMRAEIAAGNSVPDESLVRIANVVNRIMREFRGRKQAAAETTHDWRAALATMGKTKDQANDKS